MTFTNVVSMFEDVLTAELAQRNIDVSGVIDTVTKYGHIFLSSKASFLNVAVHSGINVASNVVRAVWQAFIATGPGLLFTDATLRGDFTGTLANVQTELAILLKAAAGVISARFAGWIHGANGATDPSASTDAASTPSSLGDVVSSVITAAEDVFGLGSSTVDPSASVVSIDEVVNDASNLVKDATATNPSVGTIWGDVKLLGSDVFSFAKSILPFGKSTKSATATVDDPSAVTSSKSIFSFCKPQATPAVASIPVAATPVAATTA